MLIRRKPGKKKWLDGDAKPRGGVDRSQWLTAGELADRTMMLGTRGGHLDKVELALSWGANPDRLDDFDRTPIERAAFYGHHHLIEKLLEKGSDIFARDHLKTTTFHKICMWGNVEAAKILLKHGASLQDRDVFEMTPLLRACYGGHPDMVAFLLSRRANVFDTDHNGLTVLDLAKYWRPPGDTSKIARVPKLVAILEADIAAKTAVEESDGESSHGWGSRPASGNLQGAKPGLPGGGEPLPQLTAVTAGDAGPPRPASGASAPSAASGSEASGGGTASVHGSPRSLAGGGERRAPGGSPSPLAKSESKPPRVPPGAMQASIRQRSLGRSMLAAVGQRVTSGL